MAEKTIKTKILLRYDVLSAWNEANPTLQKGEVAIVAIPTDSNELNINGTTPPQILFKVGPGEFKKLPYASGKAADVYSWAKEASLSIEKVGEGNVVSGIEWDAKANDGKGGIKFTTSSVATSESLENVQGRLAKLEAEIGDAANDYATSRIDTLEKTISDNKATWEKDDNTTYTFSQNGKSFTVTPSEGEGKTITFDYLTAKEVADAITAYGYQDADAVKAIVESYKYTTIESLNNYYTKAESDGKFSVIGHNHDDIYYRKSEIDTKVEEINKAIGINASNIEDLAETVGGIDSVVDSLVENMEAVYGDKGEINTIKGRLTEAEGKISTAEGKISTLEGHFAEGGTVTGHINNKENPHGVTAAQVGAYTKEETNALFEPYRTSADQDVIDKAIKDDIAGLKSSVGDLSGAFQFQGTKETVDDLPAASSANKGHVYLVGDLEYASNGTSWIQLGQNGDFVLDSIYQAHLTAQAAIDKGQSDKIKAIEDNIAANSKEWASKTLVTDPTAGDGKITVDGVEMVVYDDSKLAARVKSLEDNPYVLPEDVVRDSKYSHITVTSTYVQDAKGNKLEKYDDTALAGRVTTVEGKVKTLEETTIPGINATIDTLATKAEVKVERERIDSIVNTTIPTLATKDEVKNAIDNSHTHSNKDILDATTASFTTELKTKYDGYEGSISGVADRVTAVENEFKTVDNVKGTVVELADAVDALEGKVDTLSVTETSVSYNGVTFNKYNDSALAGRVKAVEDNFADWAIIWDCGGASNN